MCPEGMVVHAVAPGSIADDLNLVPGDVVSAIDGHAVHDIIDYRFALPGEQVEVLIRKANGEQLLFEIDKGYDEDLGLSFAAPFGEVRRCANNCFFCFLKQMPPGLRPSLYINDDDYRLSFWEGNFTTLTNAGRHDMERIVTQRLSPLYISVHTTDSELRRKMLNNPRAGRVMEQLCFLRDHGIAMHTQIVLCPGINDGAALERTVRDLASLVPALRTIAIVPVGLTRFRTGLYPLQPWERKGARKVLGSLDVWQDKFRRCFGTPLVYASDEFYLLAGRTVPSREVYGEFPQVENGVGLVRLFLDEATAVLAGAVPTRWHGPAFLVTGSLAAGILSDFAARLQEKGSAPLTVIPVKNNFFGPQVTVAGLLTAQDVIQTLRPLANAGGRIILPAAMFNMNGLTIDNFTIDDLATELGLDVFAAAGPEEIVKILGVPPLHNTISSGGC